MKLMRWIALGILIMPVIVLAVEEAGHSPSATADFLGRLVNFLVLFGSLFFLLRKPVVAVLLKRSQNIKAEIEAAENNKSEALKKRQASAARLSRLYEEIGLIETETKTQVMKMQKMIVQSAEEEKSRLKKLTEQEINDIRRAALQEIKSYLASRTTQIARRRIQKKMTPEHHYAFIDKSIERLSEWYEKSGSC